MPVKDVETVDHHLVGLHCLHEEPHTRLGSSEVWTAALRNKLLQGSESNEELAR